MQVARRRRRRALTSEWQSVLSNFARILRNRTLHRPQYGGGTLLRNVSCTQQVVAYQTQWTSRQPYSLYVGVNIWEGPITTQEYKLLQCSWRQHRMVDLVMNVTTLCLHEMWAISDQPSNYHLLKKLTLHGRYQWQSVINQITTTTVLFIKKITPFRTCMTSSPKSVYCNQTYLSLRSFLL